MKLSLFNKFLANHTFYYTVVITFYYGLHLSTPFCCKYKSNIYILYIFEKQNFCKQVYIYIYICFGLKMIRNVSNFFFASIVFINVLCCAVKDFYMFKKFIQKL